MKKEKIIFAAVVLVFLIALSENTCISRAEEKATWITETQIKATQIKAPLNLHIVKKSTTALQLSWNPVEGAGGYEIYRCPAGKKTYKRVKVVKNPAKGVWLNKKLKKNKTYKYRIKAYAISNGVKMLSKYAYTVSARTYTKKSKVVNVKKVVPEDYVFIDMGMEDTIRATVKTKKKGKKAVSKKVTWYSKNKDIATITKDGRITAKNKPGICYIYAKAHNGKNSKKVPVYVENQAEPEEFDLEHVEGTAKELLTKYKKEVCQVAYYFTGHIPKEDVMISYDTEDGWDLEPVNLNINEIKEPLQKIFAEFSEPLVIQANSKELTFTLTEQLDDSRLLFRTIDYYYHMNINDYVWDDEYYEIANHWGYSHETNDE